MGKVELNRHMYVQRGRRRRHRQVRARNGKIASVDKRKGTFCKQDIDADCQPGKKVRCSVQDLPESSAHGGQRCSQFKAWVLAHKGKATSDVDYNLEDPPSAYTNAIVHSRLSEYTSMARQVHGPEYDPSTHDLDGEVVMRVGGGKKRGRYWIGDSTLDTVSTPTLSQIRARSTSSSPAIRPRPDTAQSRIEALQAQLEEERRLREEMQQWMEEERKRMEEERKRMEEQMRLRDAEWQRMEQMFQWMQSLGEKMGQPMPPILFPAPPPATSTPNTSAASNEGPQDQDLSPWSRWP